MELRQLKYFWEIVQRGGFTRAAETLGIAQSALSMAVKKLEDELEVTLINRNERKLVLTLEGEALLQSAAKILGQVDGLYREMEEFKGLVRGELRVGIPGMLAAHYFPATIEAFRERYPNLRIVVHAEGSKRLEQMLGEGLLDAAILADDDLPERLEWQFLLEDEMVACVAASHRLAGRKALTLGELAAEQLFLFCEGNYQRAVIDQALAAMGCTPQIAFETNLTSLLKNVTAKGGGVCTLLSMAVDHPGLVAVPLKPAIKVRAGIAWVKDAYLSLATRAFIEFLLESVSPDPAD